MGGALVRSRYVCSQWLDFEHHLPSLRIVGDFYVAIIVKRLRCRPCFDVLLYGLGFEVPYAIMPCRLGRRRYFLPSVYVLDEIEFKITSWILKALFMRYARAFFVLWAHVCSINLGVGECFSISISTVSWIAVDGKAQDNGLRVTPYRIWCLHFLWWPRTHCFGGPLGWCCVSMFRCPSEASS